MAKKIVLEFDINSKDVKIANQDTLSLTQQLRILKKELQKGDLQPAQFDILRKKIGDTEDAIARTTTKSRGFFEVLSTLPGPVGQFAGSLSSAVDTLKVFSSFTFKDIKNSLSDIVDDVKDVVGNFLGLNDATNVTRNGLDDIKNASGDVSDSLTQTAASAGATSAAITRVTASSTGVVDASGKVMTAQQNMAAAMTATNRAIANQTVTARGAVAATESLVVAEKAATFWTTTLGKTIQGALIATGVGVLIVLIGELISLIYKWNSSTEEADAANQALNDTLEEQKRLLDIDIAAVDMATKANITRAKIAGKTEEEIFQIQKQGAQERLKLLRDYDNQLYKDLETANNNTKLSGEQRLKLTEDINKKLLQNNLDIVKQIGANEQSALDEQLRITDKSRAKQKESNDKKIQQNKEYLQRVAQDTKSANDLLRQLEQENAVLRLKDERDRQDQELKNAYKNELDKINQLKIADDLRLKLQKELDTKYALKIVQVADQRNEEDIKRSKDFLEKKYDILTAAIDNEVTRQKVERENQYRRDLQALEEDKSFIQSSEDQKNNLRMALKTAFENDIKVINKNARDKEKENALKALDDQLRLLEIRGQVLQQATQEYFRNQEELLKVAYEKEKIMAEGNAALLLEIEKKYQKDKQNLKQQEIAAYGEVAAATIASFAAVTGALASGYDEEAKTSKRAFDQRKKLQKATAIMSAASGIIQILTQPSTLPSPFDWIVKVANAAALGITTAVQIKNINKTQFEGEGGGDEGGNRMGRGYAEGGLIGGRRHAQGGTIIEAERGEAIMTRGAVTMFAPMLSMMNQMGGGVSFSSNLSTARNDNPTLTNPSADQSPMIVKTYVVENELTTSQQRQARLKDLSTL